MTLVYRGLFMLTPLPTELRCGLLAFVELGREFLPRASSRMTRALFLFSGNSCTTTCRCQIGRVARAFLARATERRLSPPCWRQRLAVGRRQRIKFGRTVSSGRDHALRRLWRFLCGRQVTLPCDWGRRSYPLRFGSSQLPVVRVGKSTTRTPTLSPMLSTSSSATLSVRRRTWWARAAAFCA